MKRPTLQRQGDVAILRVFGKERPEHYKPVKMSKLGPVLALGEVTGHHHTVVAHPEKYKATEDLPTEMVPKLGASLSDWADKLIQDKLDKTISNIEAGKPACQLYEGSDGERGWLEVERHTILRHDEHGALSLEPGNYEVIRQREYSPEGWRQVED